MATIFHVLQVSRCFLLLVVLIIATVGVSIEQIVKKTPWDSSQLQRDSSDFQAHEAKSQHRAFDVADYSYTFSEIVMSGNSTAACVHTKYISLWTFRVDSLSSDSYPLSSFHCKDARKQLPTGRGTGIAAIVLIFALLIVVVLRDGLGMGGSGYYLKPKAYYLDSKFGGGTVMMATRRIDTGNKYVIKACMIFYFAGSLLSIALLTATWARVLTVYLKEDYEVETENNAANFINIYDECAGRYFSRWGFTLGSGFILLVVAGCLQFVEVALFTVSRCCVKKPTFMDEPEAYARQVMARQVDIERETYYRARRRAERNAKRRGIKLAPMKPFVSKANPYGDLMLFNMVVKDKNGRPIKISAAPEDDFDDFEYCTDTEDELENQTGIPAPRELDEDGNPLPRRQRKIRPRYRYNNQIAATPLGTPTEMNCGLFPVPVAGEAGYRPLHRASQALSGGSNIVLPPGQFGEAARAFSGSALIQRNLNYGLPSALVQQRTEGVQDLDALVIDDTAVVSIEPAYRLRNSRAVIRHALRTDYIHPLEDPRPSDFAAEDNEMVAISEEESRPPPTATIDQPTVSEEMANFADSEQATTVNEAVHYGMPVSAVVAAGSVGIRRKASGSQLSLSVPPPESSHPTVVAAQIQTNAYQHHVNRNPAKYSPAYSRSDSAHSASNNITNTDATLSINEQTNNNNDIDNNPKRQEFPMSATAAFPASLHPMRNSKSNQPNKKSLASIPWPESGVVQNDVWGGHHSDHSVEMLNGLMQAEGNVGIDLAGRRRIEEDDYDSSANSLGSALPPEMTTAETHQIHRAVRPQQIKSVASLMPQTQWTGIEIPAGNGQTPTSFYSDNDYTNGSNGANNITNNAENSRNYDMHSAERQHFFLADETGTSNSHTSAKAHHNHHRHRHGAESSAPDVQATDALKSIGSLDSAYAGPQAQSPPQPLPPVEIKTSTARPAYHASKDAEVASAGSSIRSIEC